eukprot:Nitzschia sp. Nitz4//scaffold163_size50693//35809//37155//NITZ4_006992-RA/size50693-processed-gene-0.34-mRNA-1//1//CDS//3329538043//1901//frame0
MSHGTSGENIQTAKDTTENRKRCRNDAFGRMMLSSSTTTTSTASTSKSSTLFVPCPLCGDFSAKRFGQGRGLATHLHTIHTPWNPTKLAKKIARRQWERLQRQKPDSNHEPPCLEPYTPTTAQVEEWATRVAKLMQELEAPCRNENHNKRNSGNVDDSNNTRNHPPSSLPAPLLDRSGKPMQSYSESLSPFLQAASLGNLKILKDMLAKDETLLEERDRHGSTAEHWAAGGGHLDCLQFLLEARRTSNRTTTNRKDEQEDRPQKRRRLRRRDGKTCLHYAARNGQLHCVQYLVEEAHMDVQEATGEGTIPLHMACYGGHLPVVQYLVQQMREKKIPEATPNEWGCSPAHWVAMTISSDATAVQELCDYLLQECSVDFTALQRQGHSPLHKAAQRKNEQILRWMARQFPSEELQACAKPDVGGHCPSDIWKSVGGDEKVYQWMVNEMKW